MKIKRNHQFAKFYLNHKKVKIYSNDKRILDIDDFDAYDEFSEYLKPIEPKIIASDHFMKIQKNKDYSRPIGLAKLNELGFILASKTINPDEFRQKFKQRAYFFITKKGGNATPILKIHKELTIKYNRIDGYVQLWGAKAGYDPKSNKVLANGRGPPVYLKEKKKEFKPKNYQDVYKLMRARAYGKNIDITLNEIYIRGELLVMITEDDELITIPKSSDPHTIGITGRRGKGKSLLTNALMNQIKWLYGDKLIFMNDSLDQFYEVMLPFEDKGTGEFKRLLDKFGLRPNPLPAILLYLSAPDLKMRWENEGIAFRMVYDFKNFLDNYSYMAKGYGKWKIGDAEKYMSELMDDFLKFKPKSKFPEDIAEEYSKYIKEMMENAGEYVDTNKGQKFIPKYAPAMTTKWIAAFIDIFKYHFIDKQFPDVDTEWTLKTEDEEITGPPLMIAFEAGLVPVLNTFQAKGKPYHKNWMASLLKEILQWQIKRKRDDKQKTVYIIADEMQDIYEEGRVKDNSKEATEENFRQGRHNGIGWVYNSQSYSKLHPDIQDNTTHIFVTLTQNTEERTKIVKKFITDADLRKEVSDKMANLETFEIMMITKEEVHVWSPDGSFVKKTGAFKGSILPPMCMHLKRDLKQEVEL